MTTRTAPRWWIYQRERFPLVGNGALILAFSSGAVCFSAQMRSVGTGVRGTVAFASLLVAFVSAFLFFFQLRVSDEHKDLADDTRWRPYRPVPRGLVTLGELRTLALVAMGIQLLLALWLAPRLVGLLVLVWGYMWLMTREFGLHAYLRAHPVHTLWTHMLIIPCIDLYATACDWMTVPGGATTVRAGLIWFLVTSFFNGMVVEIGRKLRAPSDEEEGVETYSGLWGRERAVAVWFGVMGVTAVCAVAAATFVNAVTLVATVLGLVMALAVIMGVRFARSAAAGTGKRMELLAGVWTLALYVTLGIIPLVRGP
jgi:hypothetical protein